MPEKEETKRVIVTIPMSIYEKIVAKAKAENRAISNYIVTEMKKVVEQD